MTPSDFYARALAYCARYQASMTSGYRTPARNAAVGGVPHSKHLLGLALDCVPELEASDDDRRHTAAQLGLVLIVEDSHDHLQTP